MKSIKIWQDRYKSGENSGLGSRNELANYKINFLNNFIEINLIKSVLDFGCGDCYITKRIIVEKYIGVDISDYYFSNCEINENRSLFVSRFDELNFDTNFDCVICLDVLYHILEDEIDYLYKTLDNMFKYSNKYIIIYAQDFNQDESKKYNSHMFNSPWEEYIEKKALSLIYEQEHFQLWFFG